MKIVLGLIIFAAAFGLGLTSNSVSKLENPFRHECTTWSKDTLQQPLFTLEEFKEIKGKRVYSNNSLHRYKSRIGRIVGFQMVAQNKFFIVVNWSRDFDDEEFSLTYHHKDDFNKNYLELID